MFVLERKRVSRVVFFFSLMSVELFNRLYDIILLHLCFE
jgi:hypothetical protein